MFASSIKYRSPLTGPLAATLAFYLLTRIIVLTAAYTAPQDRSPSRPFNWWPDNPLVRWDSGHYLAIMESGYPAQLLEPDPTLSNDRIAFFPLYPLLVRPAAAVVDWWNRAAPGSPEAHAGHHFAMVAISHVFGLMAVLLFFGWSFRIAVARGEIDRTAAWTAARATMLLAAFPTAMYFSTGYSEAVFITCIAGALWLQAADRPWAAALACAFSTATRPTGVVLALVLGLNNLGAARASGALRRKPASTLARIGTLGLVSIAGLLAYQAYLYSHYGRSDAFSVAQRNWEIPDSNRRTLSNLLLLQPVLEPATKPFKYAARGQFAKLAEAETWNALVNVAVLAVAMYGLFRPHGIPRPAFLIPIVSFLMGYLADPYTGARLLGIARYQLAALPCFLLLAQLRGISRAIWWGALLAALLVLQVIYIRGYVNWMLVS